MTPKGRTAVVVFWGRFLISICLDPRYPWIQVVWTGLCVALLVVASVYSVVAMFTRKNATGSHAFYQAVPSSLWFIALNDEGYAKPYGIRAGKEAPWLNSDTSRRAFLRQPRSQLAPEK